MQSETLNSTGRSFICLHVRKISTAWLHGSLQCMAHAAACKQISHTCKAAACQSTSGLLVAPTSSTLLSALLGSQPSICTSISVFSRRLASCSPVTPYTHCSLVQPRLHAGFRSLASAACLLYVSFRNLCCLPQQTAMLLAWSHNAGLQTIFTDLPCLELSRAGPAHT